MCFNGQDYTYAGERTPTDNYQNFSFEVPTNARHIRVCRGSGGPHRRHLEVDVVLGDFPQCPDALRGFEGDWSGDYDVTVTPLNEFIPPGAHSGWNSVGLVGQKVRIGIQLSGTISCKETCQGTPISTPLSFPVSASFNHDIGIGVGVKATIPYLWLFKGGWFLARNAVPITESVIGNGSLLLGVSQFMIKNQILQDLDFRELASQACEASSTFPAQVFADKIIEAFPDDDNIP